MDVSPWELPIWDRPEKTLAIIVRFLTLPSTIMAVFLLHIIRTANVLYGRTLLLKPVLNCEMKELATNVGKFVFSVSQLNEKTNDGYHFYFSIMDNIQLSTK